MQSRLPWIFALLFVAPAQAQPALQARLLAEKPDFVPGQSMQLAVEVRIDEPWRLGHSVTLSDDPPARIEWSLPAGLSLRQVRFPAPRFDLPATPTHLPLDSTFVVLATMDVSHDYAAPKDASIRAVLQGAAYSPTGTAPARAEATLELPPPADAVGSADFFAAARDALPRPLGRATSISGRLIPSHSALPAGALGELAAEITVADHMHIQDRDPGVAGLIGARLFIGRERGVQSDVTRQNWPTPQTRVFESLGQVRELSGVFTIRAPLSIAADRAPGSVTIPVLFLYQACDDKGVCLAPEFAEASVPLEILPAGGPSVTNPAFAQIAVPAAPNAQPSSGRGVPAHPATQPTGLLTVFLGAFVGGMLLNIMPCVLPVIALKVFGFVRQAGEHRGRIFALGLMYTLGILASFAVLATLMVSAQKAWGGLMQSPAFLTVLSGFVLLFALSMLGVFEFQLPGRALSVADEASAREGYGGAFLNGILTTALATPCTAPGLGSALGVITRLDPLTAGSVILTIGAGLAFPYLLLSAFPAWLRFLPKPGAWMVTFKEIVGFVLIAVVLWLLSILRHQVSPEWLLATLALLLGVGMAAWILGRVSINATWGRTLGAWAAAAAVAGGGWLAGYASFVVQWNQIDWQPWQRGIGPRLAAEGKTVFVDYTASWCTTCIFNKTFVLETGAVRRELARLNVVPVKADFTSYDKSIRDELNEYGRNGVPLNIIFPAGKPDEPIILSETLTQSAVLDALKKAGPSKSDREAVSLKQP